MTELFYKAQCHCGDVQFKIFLPEGLTQPVRCNCSFCGMRGAVMVFTTLSGLEITQGADMLATYQFNSNTAKHHFCTRCGIYTHHQRRFDPTQYAVNVACIEGVSPFDFTEVAVLDGARHPADHGGGTLQRVGILRYETLDLKHHLT